MEDSFQYYTFLSLCLGFFVIGNFGNIISIIIFTRKEFIKQPTTVYLIVSNIVNLIIIFYLPFMVLPEIWTQLAAETISCQLFGGFVVILTEIQSWIYSICSLDRCITTVAPFKFQFKNKLKFQLTLIFICAITLILLCVPFITYYRAYQLESTNQTVCLFSQSLEFSWVIIYFKLEFGLFRTLLPFIITTSASFSTVYKLYSSKLKLNVRNVRRMNKEIQFAKSLVIMDILFVIFRIPSIINLTLQADMLFVYKFLYSIFALLGALHSVFIFLIFFLFNKIYRQLFKNFVFGEKNKQLERNLTKTQDCV